MLWAQSTTEDYTETSVWNGWRIVPTIQQLVGKGTRTCYDKTKHDETIAAIGTIKWRIYKLSSRPLLRKHKEYKKWKQIGSSLDLFRECWPVVLYSWAQAWKTNERFAGQTDGIQLVLGLYTCQAFLAPISANLKPWMCKWNAGSFNEAFYGRRTDLRWNDTFCLNFKPVK